MKNLLNHYFITIKYYTHKRYFQVHRKVLLNSLSSNLLLLNTDRKFSLFKK